MEIREVLKTAIAIMDEKGRDDENVSMSLWSWDWDCLRKLLLEALNSSTCDSDLVIAIEQNIDVVEGNLTGVKIDFL